MRGRVDLECSTNGGNTWEPIAQGAVYPAGLFGYGDEDAGENTLAVRVKQRAPDSSDVSFELELSVTRP